MSELEIYKKYQERLINLSARNRSLVLNQIYKKRTFDLVDIKKAAPAVYQKFIDEFILGSKEEIEIIPDIQKWQKKIKTEANRVMKTAFSEEGEFKPESKKLLIELLGENFNWINGDLESISLKEYVKNLIEESTNLLGAYSHSIRTLYREAEAEKKENGLYNIKVAAYFGEGKFNDGSKVRAPLSFIAVELILKNNTWCIKKSDYAGFISNEVLQFSAIKCNQVDIKNHKMTIIEPENCMDEILKYYEDNGLSINRDEVCDTEFKSLKKIKAKDYDTFEKGKIKVKQYLVLGDFPLSNSIYEDYSKLISENRVNKQISNLFGDENESASENELEETVTQSKETDFYYMSELDYSQEIAILNAGKHSNLVIFGPPGTGKSQTITNIIADSLAKGKRVLMVSQKRAALDVIYNRLGSIQDKAVLIHDANIGKKEFYAKNVRLFEKFETKYGVEFHYKNRREQISPEGHLLAKSDIKKLSKDIDAFVDEMNLVYEFLYTKNIHGFTGQEMLLKSIDSSELSSNDPKLNKVRRLFKKLVYNKLSIEDIVLIQEKQKDIRSIDSLREYNELGHKHPLLTNLNSKYNEFDALEVIDSFDNITLLFEKFDSILSDEDKNGFNEWMNNLNENEFDDKLNVKMKSEYDVLISPSVTGIMRMLKMLFQRKKLLQLESENLKKYEEIYKNKKSDVESIRANRNELLIEIGKLSSYFENQFIESVKRDALNRTLPINIGEFKKASDNFTRYKELEKEHSKLFDGEKKIIEELVHWEYDSTDLQVIVESLEKLYYTTELIEMKISGSLEKYKSYINSHKKSTKNVNELMTRKRELTKNLIEIKWDKKFLEVSKEYEYRELKRISSLKRKVRSVRESFNAHRELLNALYPCVLLGPEMVSSILPLEENYFDVVIFDEASQMFVEEAIPTLYRGKKVIVAGDDKQLRPNSAFKSKTASDDSFEEFDDDELLVDAALEQESLLDLAKVTYRPTSLMFHYRSRAEELINFSNHAFYGGKLKTVPNQHDLSKSPPIKRVFVENGNWLNRANHEEALEVVKLIKEILKTRKENETIGVITFNITQKDAIEDLLEVEMLKNPEFNIQLTAEQNRTDEEEDISLFVKNIENVQGDERDIIIFSTGYAKDENGRLARRFGSLSQDGGENRLNVAISRAKKQIYVVTSFEPEELNVENVKNRGPKLFKQYLQYIRLVSNGQLSQAKTFLGEISKVTSVQEGDHFDSDFEIEVCDAIRDMGYTVLTQVGASGYKIDLVVYDERTSRYVLGIECDGATYHSSKSAKENDIYRQKFLESRGWKIFRIWSTDWWSNRGNVLSELDRVLKLELKKE